MTSIDKRALKITLAIYLAGLALFLLTFFAGYVLGYAFGKNVAYESIQSEECTLDKVIRDISCIMHIMEG